MADTIINEGPFLLRVLIVTLALGGIFIFARIITRTVIRPQFGWEDALIIVTWLTILGFNIAWFIAIGRGLGQPVHQLSPEQYVSAVHALVIGEVLAVASFPTGKASVACLLIRLFPDKKLKWVLWTFVAFNAIFFYIDAILLILQCQPVSFQWDHSIPGGTCWQRHVVTDWGYLTGIFGCITDFTFALLPWHYIRKLQMDLKIKICVGAALSTGVFAGVCSILKIYYTSVLNSASDFTYDTIPLNAWGSSELAAINVAACIPTLGPLFLWVSDLTTQYIRSSPSRSGRSSTSTLFPAKQRLTFRNPDSALLKSADPEQDRNIYQFKTYEVSVKKRGEEQSDSETGTKTTISTGHTAG